MQITQKDIEKIFHKALLEQAMSNTKGGDFFDDFFFPVFEKTLFLEGEGTPLWVLKHAANYAASRPKTERAECFFRILEDHKIFVRVLEKKSFFVKDLEDLKNWLDKKKAISSRTN